jgi:hypothetical protein
MYGPLTTHRCFWLVFVVGSEGVASGLCIERGKSRNTTVPSGYPTARDAMHRLSLMVTNGHVATEYPTRPKAEEGVRGWLNARVDAKCRNGNSGRTVSVVRRR